MRGMKNKLLLCTTLLFPCSGVLTYAAWSQQGIKNDVLKTVDITIDDLTIIEGSRNLGEYPYYLVETYVNTTNGSREDMRSCQFVVQVQVYEDKRYHDEITQGLVIKVTKQEWVDNGRYAIQARVELQNAQLAGKELYVKVHATFEKV